MKAKRMLSALLSMLMLVSVLACLPLNVSADESETLTVTYTNPVITADAGDAIDLTVFNVELNGTTTWTASSLKWTYEDETITTFTPESKGVYKLVATSGDVSKAVYVVAKAPEETEYVLYENDFSGTLDDLKAEGWAFPSTTTVSVSDGALHLGSKSGDYYRAILPEFLADFGDYTITAQANQTDVLNSSRWCSIAYRMENANSKYYPYYHMCVRANTTSSTVEFAQRTASDAWNVLYTASETLNMTDAGYHTLTVNAFENTVQYLIDDASILYISDATAHTKGFVGLISNYGTMNVDSIRVTVRTEAPERPYVAPKLVDASGNRTDSNITNYVSNQAYATTDTLDALLNAESYPVAILLDLTGKAVTQAELEGYLTSFTERNIIPQFKLDTKSQVDALNSAVKATSTPEVLVASSDTAIVKYARTKNKTVIRAAYDISDVTTERLSDDQIFEYYSDAVGAYAQAIIVPYQLATKEYVAKWQEYELAVWAFGTGIDTETEAAWLVASGANAVVSDNWQAIADIQTEVFTAENSLTRTPVWTAHRGYSSAYAENSMAAFIGAYEVGADCIEIDVHLSSDGVVMIMHDETIDRTTDGKGYIKNMTCEQLQQYHLKHNGKVTEEVIPTFEEFLKYFQGKDVKVLCEIKSGQSGLPKACADLVKKYGMEDQIVYISFYANQLTSIKNYTNTSTGYLLSAVAYTDGYDTVGTLNSYFTQQSYILNYHSTLAINYGNLSAEFLRDANDRGVTLWTWTYSLSASTQVCNNFLSGMNGMTTNDPQYLKNTVKTISAPKNVYISPNGTASLNVKSLTYNGTQADITANSEIIMLNNDGVISVANGKITALKDEGTASFMVSYKTSLPNGTQYTLYSQPITVNVGEIEELTLIDGSSYELNGNLLTGVKAETTVQTLLDNLVNAEAVTLYDASGKEITSSTALVGNGTVISYNGIDTKVIVKGDLNGDGKVAATDYIMLKKSVLKTYTLSEDQALAADIDGDGKIIATDYIKLKRHVLRTFNIYG